MKVLTYTSYKEHCDLYTKIHGSIAINSCQIELTQKYIILLSKVSIMIYKADKRTSIENTNFIHFNLSAGTYSIDDFNAKILQQRQVKKELDGQPSSLLARMLVSNYKETFSPIHLVFLELDIDQPHLDLKILYKNNNEVIPRTFYLQLLNKE